MIQLAVKGMDQMTNLTMGMKEVVRVWLCRFALYLMMIWAGLLIRCNNASGNLPLTVLFWLIYLFLEEEEKRFLS